MALSVSLAAGSGAAALGPLAAAATPQSVTDKARAASQDFEAVYINTMFQQMFTSVDGEGPFGGGAAGGVWRSFLTDEYAKTFAKSGGIGIADHVYRALIAQQETQGK